ncbi:MAG TPA: hypothetical protein VGC82_14420 [Rhodopila sp.]
MRPHANSAAIADALAFLAVQPNRLDPLMRAQRVLAPGVNAALLPYGCHPNPE